MTLSKKYENLTIYIIGPLEDDTLAEQEFKHIQDSIVDSGIPKAQVLNPCEQEKDKTGYCVKDSQSYILGLRQAGRNEDVDNIYRRIWEVDIENVRKADLVVANIPAGTRFVGTTREATLASLIMSIDLVRSNFDEDQKKIYEEEVRPGLKKIGFFNKPIYLITPAKTRINGTFIHGLVRASGGKVFPNITKLVEHLKELYK